MAITAPRTMGDFAGFITPTQAGPIFDDARRQSVIMQLVPQMALGANGAVITTTTSKPTANWVGEGGQKPTSQGGKGLMPVAAKKLASIVVNSAEVVRADPGGYITGLYADLAEAFATAFDLACLYAIGGDGTGSGPFTTALADTTKEIYFGDADNAYLDVVAGLKLLVDDGRKLTGFAFGDVAEPVFLEAVDANKRPLFIDTPPTESALPISLAQLRQGRMLGRPAFIGQGVDNADVLGFAGDWRKARWGVVGGISYRVSTEGTVTIDGDLVSLFENNLVAILAEAEYGFAVADEENFVKFLSGDDSSS